MTQTKEEKALRLLDGAFHDLALDVAESEVRTQEELAKCGVRLDEAASRVTASARNSLAQARRARLDRARQQRLASKSTTALERFTDWTREALIKKIEQLQLDFPGQMQVEHRDLVERPTEDLRSLLADLTDMAESNGD